MTLLLALLLALVVSALVLALLLRLAPRTGLMDLPGERRRIHREAAPRVGGLAIFAGLLASRVVAPPWRPWCPIWWPIWNWGAAGARCFSAMRGACCWAICWSGG